MKDVATETALEGRPDVGAAKAVNFCIQSLCNDNQHSREDKVAGNCTYEELLGALLLAADAIAELESQPVEVLGV